MTRSVGVYVSQRGLSIVQAKRKGSGLEIVNNVEVPGSLGTPSIAAERLVAALQNEGIKRADVVVVVRGFGMVHQVLSVPRAPDALMTPIAERELRHLEPSLGDAVVGWLPLPDEPNPQDGTPQRQLLVAGAPRDLIEAFETSLSRAGHKLSHVTALPAAIQRLGDEFVAHDTATVLVAPLGDGAFLGFFLAGALRLVVEPPMGEDEREHDAAALAEETELGAMFVRQQFRGAQLSSVVIASSDESLPADAESTFQNRLGVPAKRLKAGALSAGAYAALGGIVDSTAEAPLALVGPRQRALPQPRSILATASWAAIALGIVAGLVAVFIAYDGREKANALAEARRKIAQQTTGVNSIQETTDQRQLIRDARTAVAFASQERIDLQRALIATAAAINPSIRMEGLSVHLATDGWAVTLRGTIHGQTNGPAVQALNDFYQSLPRRMSVKELSLDQLGYGTEQGMGYVTFQLSFVVPTTKKAS